MSYDLCFQNLPPMETERLILRQITNSKSDGKDSLEFINDYSVYRFWGLYDEANDTDGTKKPETVIKLDYHYQATMEEYKAGRELTWLMELKDSHKVIGEIVLYDFHLKKQADIGYRINKNYWGQGFASEAGQAVVKFAFEYMDLTRLQIRCFHNNKGSVRVAEKLGFRQEGYIKKGVILNVQTDYYIFGYLVEEYRLNPIDDMKVKLLV
ncbi:GNAT family N-acetyltransferase [Mobilitalea sibirica]|uniref:GNAT family N-acetyltransferase n=1 Tax=Mobilitalea sibirica TaxID=1462919 RepID=A0A8J7HBN6_9FIRM|nr:GNAT family protein [Mobilitalea sibirica]MBH1942256.1 GNAT family N-acetyltransferase [Mobilitalea sibirica]